MKKLKGILVLVLLLALLASPVAVLASDVTGAKFYGLIQVTNNGTAVTNEVTTCNISTQNLIDGGYLNSSANDCAIQSSSGADLPFMPSVSASFPWCLWVPTMGADSIKTDILYTANSTGGKIRYFPATGGMTTLDDPQMELGDNFTITQSGWVAPASGNTDTYLDFVRANTDWVSIPDHANLDFTDGAGTDKTATVIAWVNLDDATSSALLAKSTNAGNNNGWIFRTEAADELNFICLNDTAGEKIGRKTAAGNITAYEGKWVHLAATYDATETSAGINLYINGVDLDTADDETLPYNGMDDTTAVLGLGSYNAGTAGLLDGKMAEAKIYTVELSPAEVLADYNGGHRVADLEAWYRLDEGTGNPLDNTANAHHSTANLADWETGAGYVNLGHLVKKPAAFYTTVDADGDITSWIAGQIPVTATGVSSGEHVVTTRQMINLLTNGDMENGNGGVDDWTLSAAGGETETWDAVTKRINTHSMAILRNGNDCYSHQNNADFASYAGQKLVFGAWVYATVADRVRLSIDDGAAALSYSSYHPGDSEWHWITLTHTMDATPTALDVACRVDTGDTTGYFDAAVLIAGDDFEDFEGNMLSNWSFELGDPPIDWFAPIDQSVDQVKIGAYSANITRSGIDVAARSNIPEFVNYRGETVIAGCWVYATEGNRARIALRDTASFVYSDYHTGDSTWQWLTRSMGVDAAATFLYLYLQVFNGDTTAYFDGAIMVKGTTTELNTTKRIDHLQILVDDVWQDSAGAATVPNTATDWAFLQNNVMPYMEYQKIWIGGVLQQHIRWEYDTTFYDTSGFDNDASPSFRGTPSDPDVSAELISFLPVAEAKAPAYALEEEVDFIEEVPVIVSEFGVTPPAGTFPLAGVIVAVANATDTPPQLPLVIIAFFVIIALSLAISSIMRKYGSGTILVKVIVIAAIMGVFVGIGNFGVDFWMIFVFLTIGIALSMASRHVSWA